MGASNACLSDAGSSRVVVQSAEVLDLTGETKATAATPAGVIFCPWNPDESYARDALLRVQVQALLSLARAAICHRHQTVVSTQVRGACRASRFSC